MSLYSIKELESLSDIKSHTIRIWEKRYGLFEPERTETNIRVYNDEQLKKLLNVALLTREGIKISKIAEMSLEEIESSVMEKVDDAGAGSNTQIDDAINRIIFAGLSYNETLFQEVFEENIEKMGMVQILLRILYPALVKIGYMWLGNQMFPAQEHFVSQLVKRKLYASIERESNIKPNGRSTGNRWILFLPGDEVHETGLMFAHLLLLQKGSEIIYLGERVPLSNLPYLRDEAEPTHVLYFINTTPRKVNLQGVVDEIESIFHSQYIYISGTPQILEGLDLKKATWLKSPHDLMEMKG